MLEVVEIAEPPQNPAYPHRARNLKRLKRMIYQELYVGAYVIRIPLAQRAGVYFLKVCTQVPYGEKTVRHINGRNPEYVSNFDPSPYANSQLEIKRKLPRRS